MSYESLLHKIEFLETANKKLQDEKANLERLLQSKGNTDDKETTNYHFCKRNDHYESRLIKLESLVDGLQNNYSSLSNDFNHSEKKFEKKSSEQQTFIKAIIELCYEKVNNLEILVDGFAKRLPQPKQINNSSTNTDNSSSHFFNAVTEEKEMEVKHTAEYETNETVENNEFELEKLGCDPVSVNNHQNSDYLNEDKCSTLESQNGEVYCKCTKSICEQCVCHKNGNLCDEDCSCDPDKCVRRYHTDVESSQNGEVYCKCTKSICEQCVCHKNGNLCDEDCSCDPDKCVRRYHTDVESIEYSVDSYEGNATSSEMTSETESIFSCNCDVFSCEFCECCIVNGSCQESCSCSPMKCSLKMDKCKNQESSDSSSPWITVENCVRRRTESVTKPEQRTKVFVTQLSPITTNASLKRLFDSFGTVLACDRIGDYAFVHFKAKEEAKTAIRELHNYRFEGSVLHVALSKRNPKSVSDLEPDFQRGAKLFVAQLGKNTTSDSLRRLFELYGTVIECERIREFAFVIFKTRAEAKRAKKTLHNRHFEGSKLHVADSTYDINHPNQTGSIETSKTDVLPNKPGSCKCVTSVCTSCDCSLQSTNCNELCSCNVHKCMNRNNGKALLLGHLKSALHTLDIDKVIELLREEINCNFIIDNDSNTLLHWSIKNKNTKLVDFLINKNVYFQHKNKKVETPIMCAYTKNQVEIMQKLFKVEPKLNIKYQSVSIFHQAARDGREEVVKLLLKYKFNTNDSDGNKWTPLHFAVRYQKINIVALLLNAGADWRKCNRDGKTPLDFAKSSTQEILQLFNEIRHS